MGLERVGRWCSFGAGDKRKVEEVVVAGDGVRDLGIIVICVGVWLLNVMKMQEMFRGRKQQNDSRC